MIHEENVETLLNRMNDMTETLKPDRTDLEMVYEIMLKMGIPLDYSVTAAEIEGKTAYPIGDNCLVLVCLQPNLSDKAIRIIAEDYLPSKLILSEKSLADDSAMSNAYYILKNKDIELKFV